MVDEVIRSLLNDRGDDCGVIFGWTADIENFFTKIKELGLDFSVRSTKRRRGRINFSSGGVKHQCDNFIIPFLTLAVTNYECAHGNKYYRTKGDKKKKNEDNITDSSKQRRNRLRASKKLNCVATLRIQKIQCFPEYGVKATTKNSYRKLALRDLRECLHDPGTVICVERFHVTISACTVHNHPIGVTSHLFQRSIRIEINSMVEAGLVDYNSIKRSIDDLVFFSRVASKMENIYGPDKQTIRNLIRRAKKRLKKKKILEGCDGKDTLSAISNIKDKNHGGQCNNNVVQNENGNVPDQMMTMINYDHQSGDTLRRKISVDNRRRDSLQIQDNVTDRQNGYFHPQDTAIDRQNGYFHPQDTTADHHSDSFHQEVGCSLGGDVTCTQNGCYKLHDQNDAGGIDCQIFDDRNNAGGVDHQIFDDGNDAGGVDRQIFDDRNDAGGVDHQIFDDQNDAEGVDRQIFDDHNDAEINNAQKDINNEGASTSIVAENEGNDRKALTSNATTFGDQAITNSQIRSVGNKLSFKRQSSTKVLRDIRRISKGIGHRSPMVGIDSLMELADIREKLERIFQKEYISTC